MVAGFVRNTDSWPNWWGVLDVCLAFVLGILSIAVMALAHDKVDKRAEEVAAARWVSVI